MKYDVAVIGGGISGLAAALFTGHAGLRTVVFDSGQSQIKKVSSIRNNLGAPGLSGDDLLSIYQSQLIDFAEIKHIAVETLKQDESGFSLIADGEAYDCDYVVVATNLDTSLLEALNFDIGVNENIKSGKIKKIVGVTQDGTTHIPNLYIAGLLAGIPSQVMVAAGQGAAVGIQIAQKATGDKYMWHDQ
ncbi:FAD-binding protein [Bacillus tuaregi]|uniref:FAD-binding protein n=1 Tax=Bacillus tuaregi TaxID=1816695 RepID=UPI0008F8EB5E|nr:FAD-binding protein [Bacillus tuaregi]